MATKQIETLERLTRVETKIDNIKEDVSEIKELVKTQNSRITKVENKLAYTLGKLAGIALIVSFVVTIIAKIIF